MKVLQLRSTDGEGPAIALHPQVTVVTGLDPVHRAWLIDVLGRIAGGRGLPATGEIDAHGIRFDLDDDTLALLGLDNHVATVVTAADLPGHDPAQERAVQATSEATHRRDQLAAELSEHRTGLADAVAERDAAALALAELSSGEGEARQAIAAAGAERSRLEFELQASREERSAREDELARAVTAREQAIEARNRAAHGLVAAQARRREAIAEATQAAAALEEARSGLDPAADPSAAVAAARSHLAAAERAAAEADPDHGESPLSRRLADLERRRVELARLEAAMGDRGSEPVAQALDELQNASSEAPPLVAALALADTWRDLHQQIGALEAGVSPAEREAEERVGAARRAVVEAESDFNQPVLTPEQIAKVEAAHSAVLEAQDRSEGRFGGSRARKRLEELRDDERRVLERLGFSTYADYMMSASSRGVGPANRAILDTARTNLAAAEENLLTLPGAGDRARRRTELVQRREAVAPRVADLLGHEPTGPEAEDELRSLREPQAGDAVALDALADALSAVEVHVGPTPYDRDDLVLLARAYLAEERGAEVQRADVTAALTALDGAVELLRVARSASQTEVPDLATLPPLAEPELLAVDASGEAAALTLREARWAEVEAARTAVAAAEAEVVRQREAHARVAELETGLAERTAAEAASAEALREVEAEQGDGADNPVQVAADAVAEAEAALARARESEDEVTARITSHQGSTGAEGLVAEAQERVIAAEGVLRSVAEAEQTTAIALAAAEAALANACEAETAATAASEDDRSSLVDDTDWELLSRLAKVRSVGPGGSVPLVLDDPFAALRDDEVGRVLDQLAQLGGAVQLVVVSDRPAVANWAAGLGPDRVAVHAA